MVLYESSRLKLIRNRPSSTVTSGNFIKQKVALGYFLWEWSMIWATLEVHPRSMKSETAPKSHLLAWRMQLQIFCAHADPLSTCTNLLLFQPDIETSSNRENNERNLLRPPTNILNIGHCQAVMHHTQLSWLLFQWSEIPSISRYPTSATTNVLFSDHERAMSFSVEKERTLVTIDSDSIITIELYSMTLCKQPCLMMLLP